MASLEERFWSKVDRREGAECWEWTGPSRPEYNLTGKSRALFSVNGKSVFAARFAFEVANNTTLLPGLHVLHACDNPMCVNPAHLSAGTLADNQRDRRAKGRHGVVHRPLNNDSVRAIHRLIGQGVSNMALAVGFGVSPAMVSYIRNGRAWAHIYEEFHGAVAA